MKTNLLIVSALAAGSIALYLVRKMKAAKPVPQIPFERSRHLTTLFSKAKNS